MQSVERKKAYNYGYVVVSSAFFIMLAQFAIYYSFGVFFTPMISELGWTRATTSGAFSLSCALTGVLGIVIGGLTDRFGPRAVMTTCGLFLGLGYFLMSQAGTKWHLYLFFGGIVGTGMAGSFVVPVSTVARWFVKRRGTMTGIVTAGIGMAALIGPPVANGLISFYGWRSAY